MLKKYVAALLAGATVVGAAAQAAINPIPSVDIIVRKRPEGIVVGQNTSDEQGRFSVKVVKPGQYTLSTACRQKACQKFRQPFAFTSTPSLKPNKDGTYDFTVGADGPFVVSGVISIFDRWGNMIE